MDDPRSWLRRNGNFITSWHSKGNQTRETTACVISHLTDNGELFSTCWGLFVFLNQGTKKMQTCKLMRTCFCTTAVMKNPTTRGTARLLHCHLQGSLSITRFAILTEREKKEEKKKPKHLCSTNNKHTKWLWAPVKRY